MIEYLPIVITGIGIIASILYYTSVLRNQNKTRKTQLYMQLFLKESSEEFQSQIHDFNKISTTNYEEIRKKLLSDKEFAVRFRTVWRFFDGIGEMLKEGLLDAETVHYLSGGLGVLWSWDVIEPYALERRRRMNRPDFMAGFEYYANAIIDLRKGKGLPYERSEKQHKWTYPH